MGLTVEALPHEREHVLFRNVSWQFYEDVLREVEDRRLFVTYDRGRLEIMSPSYEHDNRARLILRIIHIASMELGIPLATGGSTTFRREDLDRGLEPDECFWLEHEPAVRGKAQVDLATDPPPDLAVEVEVSRRLLDRVAIYAALGVPELWRYDGRRLGIYALSAAGTYEQVPQSRWFPSLPPQRLEAMLEQSRTMDETSWARTVRDWVRRNLVKP